jgi:hypothetical protein
MAWFKKKADPISERSRVLNAEIAALENKIKKYESQVPPPPAPGAHMRSTAMPRPVKPDVPAAPTAPVFVKVDTHQLMKPAESAAAQPHFNDLGVRKFDLPALIRKVRGLFRGPTASNPRLVSYLAAGGIQGMRPLRREKRVARNRTVALAIILLLVLLGIIAVLRPGR